MPSSAVIELRTMRWETTLHASCLFICHGWRIYLTPSSIVCGVCPHVCACVCAMCAPDVTFSNPISIFYSSILALQMHTFAIAVILMLVHMCVTPNTKAGCHTNSSDWKKSRRNMTEGLIQISVIFRCTESCRWHWLNVSLVTQFSSIWNTAIAIWQMNARWEQKKKQL